MIECLPIVATWIACLISHIFLASLWIPSTTLQSYKESAVDRTSLALVGTWYCIGISWLFWMTTPSPGQRLLGVIIFGSGSGLVIAAMRSNPFFRRNVQHPERIVRQGPYAYLRHPGYLGMCLMALGTIAMLGHLIGLIPLIIYYELIRRRIVEENKLLYGGS